MDHLPAGSLRAAMRMPRRAYLRSRWPWRALGWLCQIAAAGCILAGLFAIAIAPAATDAWHLHGLSAWWLLEIAAIGATWVGLAMVGAWQRRAVAMIGLAPIASRSAWSTPAVRRRGEMLLGSVQDLAAGVVILVCGAFGVLFGWLGWMWLPAGFGGLTTLVIAGFNGVVEPQSDAYLTLTAVLMAACVAVTFLLPWLWGWVCLAGTWALRMVYDGRGDLARRQSAERQAATIRLTDLFSAERHRIERDLHDGAQQRIVALGFTLGRLEHELASRGQRDDPALALAREAVRENQEVLAELRDLVRAVRPQVLTDLGIRDALEEVAARSSVPATVQADLDGRPDPLVEETVYFLVLEALTNATRHAGCDRVMIMVRRSEDRIEVAVSDNGCGGAQIREGGGLAGLIDRVAAIGGLMEVSSPVGGTTTITAAIPWRVPYDRARHADRLVAP